MRTAHDAYVGGHSENNIKCVVRMTISGERTNQLDIIADFLLHHSLYE